MSQQEFQNYWKELSDLLAQIPNTSDEQLNMLIKRYNEQNILFLNDVLSTSVDNLKRLQKAKSANDIICTQARFTNEINKKLTLSAQRFLNASLGHIADYNEWLKEHCDLATD